VILFTLFSFLCGFAGNFTSLVIFRTFQGAVSGPIIPLSQSILLREYPPHKKDFALAIWVMIVVVGPVLGPILGGWITDQYGWGWIFYINVPFGIVCALLSWGLLMKRETKRAKEPIDYLGVALLALGIGCFQIFLDKGYDLDWFGSPWIRGLFATTIVSLSFFVVWTLTEKNPVVDLRLLKNRNFSVATINLGVSYISFYGGVVILPLWLQTQMGYTPTWAGIASAPIGIIPLFLSPLLGKFGKYFDPRWLVIISFVLFAWTFYLQSTLNTNASFEEIAMPRLWQGAALTFYYLPLVNLAITGIAPDKLASATGLFNFVRTISLGIGTSVYTTIWNDRAIMHRSRIVEGITDFNEVTNQALQQLAEVGVQGLKGVQVLEDLATQQAYMLGTNDIFWLAGVSFIPLIALVLFCKPAKNNKPALIPSD
jgi:DHA2 family multidrug resistance protein